MVTAINLNNPNTFLLKRLTVDDAKKRYVILVEAQAALEGTQQQLSPRSVRELGELAEVLGDADDKVNIGTVKITRQEPGQFYKIEFNQNPVQLTIKSFNQVSTRVNAMVRCIPAGSQKGILQSVVSPEGEMGWYQTATLRQMDAILRTDF